MNRPALDEHGGLEIASFDTLTHADLEQWLYERLRQDDWGSSFEPPHYLIAITYPKLSPSSQESLGQVVLASLADLATNPETKWAGEAGSELLMLTDPVLLPWPRRDDAIDLLLRIAGSPRFLPTSPSNVYFRSLQSLVALRYRGTLEFWRAQFEIGGRQWLPLIIAGLSLIDVSAPFTWLTEVEWSDDLEYAVIGLLPSLIEDYGTAKVISQIERVLSLLAAGGAKALSEFCRQEAIALTSAGPRPMEDYLRAGAARRIVSLFGEHSATERLLHEIALWQDSVQSQAFRLIPHRSATDDIPASDSQWGHWFIGQLDSHDTTHNMVFSISLTGTLVLNAFQDALSEIVRRHWILRTTFSDQYPPLQIVHPSNPLAPCCTDVIGLSSLEQESLASELADSGLNQPLNLSEGPLIKLGILRAAPGSHLLLLFTHAAVFDQWSLQIFLAELAVLYESFAAGTTSPLMELPVQYADFALWQSEWLSSDVAATHIAYWRDTPSGDIPALKLNLDGQEPSVPGAGRRAAHAFEVPAEVTDLLTALASSEMHTVSSILLGAFEAVLYRYTRQAHFLVGAVDPGRHRLETAKLIGPLATLLVLRADLSDNPTFRDLMRRTARSARDALDHRDAPAGGYRVLGEGPPVVEVGFSFLNLLPRLDLASLRMFTKQFSGYSSELDLELQVREGDRRLQGLLFSRKQLFEGAYVSRMLRDLNTVLQRASADPDQRLADLVGLTEPERHQLIVEWSGVDSDYLAEEVTVHRIFEERAKRRPDATAVVLEEQHITYQQLDRRANQVANYLKRNGVVIETLVGLCVQPSVEAIVGLLGVLKAGGAYVPLDPTYPEERLALMAQDCGIRILLTQERLIGGAVGRLASAVSLDSSSETIAKESEEDPSVEIRGPNLAYVMYTSGSTGQPKGVLVSHAGIYNAIASSVALFALDEDAIIPQLASLSFDVSAMEIFAALSAGGKLCLVEGASRLGGYPTAEFIRRFQCTALVMTPAVLGVVPNEGLVSVCTVVVGGDIYSHALVAKWSRERRFFNAYGPTEASICSCAMEVRDDHYVVPPVGRAFNNVQTYILDSTLLPVPVGVQGELNLGGTGLARGYLNQVRITADQFLPSPFGRVPGERIYRTGDMARFLPDGSIQVLGRVDNRVKIRGFRIEIGEVEVALRRHSGVKDALVMAQETPFGKRLIAYLVPTEDESVEAIALRRYLKATLPGYMIPSTFVTLQSVPLTSNGKVDRRALPTVRADNLLAETDPIPPRTETERSIAKIWQEILGIDHVGVTDNFFDLGGDSILCIMVAGRISEELCIEMPVSRIFEGPTVAEMAALIDHPRAADENEDAADRLWPSLKRIGTLNPGQPRPVRSDRK
jgi:amino acid adenylation domain-containing protein